MQVYIVRYKIPYENDLLPEYFSCQADDPDHAIEQCSDAYPDAEILSVKRVHPHDGAED